MIHVIGNVLKLGPLVEPSSVIQDLSRSGNVLHGTGYRTVNNMVARFAVLNWDNLKIHCGHQDLVL